MYNLRESEPRKDLTPLEYIHSVQHLVDVDKMTFIGIAKACCMSLRRAKLLYNTGKMLTELSLLFENDPVVASLEFQDEREVVTECRAYIIKELHRRLNVTHSPESVTLSHLFALFDAMPLSPRQATAILSNLLSRHPPHTEVIMETMPYKDFIVMIKDIKVKLPS